MDTREAILEYWETVGMDTQPGLRDKALARYMRVTGRITEQEEVMVGYNVQAHNADALATFRRKAEAAMFADGDLTLHSDHTRMPEVRIRER